MLASNYWLADYTKLVLAIIVVAIHSGLRMSIQNEQVKLVVEYAESSAQDIIRKANAAKDTIYK